MRGLLTLLRGTLSIVDYLTSHGPSHCCKYYFKFKGHVTITSSPRHKTCYNQLETPHPPTVLDPPELYEYVCRWGNHNKCDTWKHANIVHCAHPFYSLCSLHSILNPYQKSECTMCANVLISYIHLWSMVL